MRHLGSCSLRLSGPRLILGVLALAGGIGEGSAAPLDFLFGEPPLAERPAYRLRRRPAPQLRQPARPEAEIPLPAPRPHFPGDPPAAATQAEDTPRPAPAPESRRAAEPPETAARPDRTIAPVGAPSSEAGSPPLPPEKPADLGTPARPSAGSEVPKPEVPKPEAPQPKVPKTEAPPAGPARPGMPATSPSGAEPVRPVIPSPAPPAAPIPPPKPAELAAPAAPGQGEPGKPAAPAVAPSGATTAFTPRAPEDDPQCPSRLTTQKVGIEATSIGPQPDARCTVVEPVHLVDVTMADGSKIAFPEHPTIACVTADSFSSYVRDLLAPLARGTFGASLTAVWTGPGLECRSRDHVFGAKLSAHGQGLAIDIAQLKLADGRMVEVGMPKTDAETAFETAARAGACGYFHTVLGPGSDAYHRTHWHFDLEVRGSHGDSKYCK